MPATPALLKKLKEALGEEATRDLVTWVDQGWTYQMAQLRELADLHYSRFDARLEQRLAEMRAALQTEMAQGDASLRAEMAAQRADLIKWMFIFWAGTVIPIAGLLIALVKL